MADRFGPRDRRGRFFDRRCIDPNCDGELVFEEYGYGHHRRWICNGLTHLEDEGPLIACSVWHEDGAPPPAHP